MATITQRCGAWRVQIRRGDRRLNRTFDTEAAARAWAAIEDVKRPVSTSPPVSTALASRTVADLFDRYAREVSPNKRGWRWEVIRFRKLAPDFPMLATGLTKEAIAAWRDARLKVVSRDTVRREITLMSGALTHAMQEWSLDLVVNPFRQIRRPAKLSARTRRVSDAERAAIVRTLGWDQEHPPVTIQQWAAWGFCFALETMMRTSEIVRLTWPHVHLEKKYCVLPQTKNGDMREVPLSPNARALLAMLTPRHPEARVVPVNPGTAALYFRRAVRAAGIVNLHFHDTRRESLTRMARKIPHVADLARMSGHRGDLRSLMIYYRPTVEDLADLLD